VKLPIWCASNLAAPKKKYRVFVIQVPLHSVEIYMTIHRYIFPNDGVDPGNVKEKGVASSCEMQLPDVLSNWEDHSVYGHEKKDKSSHLARKIQQIIDITYKYFFFAPVLLVGLQFLPRFR
jgi:hypothetical protein